MEEKIQLLKLPLVIFILHVFTTFHSIEAFSQNDTGKVYLKGTDMQVKYTKNRQISFIEVSFMNTSKTSKSVILDNAFLLRGTSEEPLKNAQFEYYDRKTVKSSEMTIKPRSKAVVRVVFKPFMIFTGSQYAVKTVVSSESFHLNAVSRIDIMKLGKIDPNKYQNFKK
jgi:hypothetical protein